MATVAEPKMEHATLSRKVTAKPRPDFDVKSASKRISARFSESLKYLAR
jgi:hypothetical protein